jgi:hypothetical protein
MLFILLIIFSVYYLSPYDNSPVAPDSFHGTIYKRADNNHNVFFLMSEKKETERVVNTIYYKNTFQMFDSEKKMIYSY